MKKENTQVNLMIPKSWKEELENLARIYSVEEGRTISYQELMRTAIREKFQLEKEDIGSWPGYSKKYRSDG